MIDPVVHFAAAAESGSERQRAVRFAATIAAVLCGIAAFKLWRGATRTAAILGAVAVFLLLLSFALPGVALALRRGWLWLGGLLGKVNSAIILSLMYLVVLTPLGVVMRIIGRRSFRPAAGADYAQPRKPRDPKHFERPY